MIWLTKEQVIFLHSEVNGATGGLDGLRDDNLLQSALLAPMQTYDRIELFPSVVDKAARLGYGLTRNHPFIDGNKRIGAHAMLVVLALNGIPLAYSQGELSDTFLQVAAGNLSYEGLRRWIYSHIKIQQD